MPFDDFPLTPPPPAYTPPTRRQDAPSVDSESYSRLTQSYASIWSDCDGRDLPDRVSCFTHDVYSYQDPEDYTTLHDPNLSFLATIQSFLASAGASVDASASANASPTPGAASTPSPSSPNSAATASTTGGALTSPKPSSPPSSSSSSSSNHTGAIIGGVLAGVAALALAAAAFLLYRRRTARKARAPSAEFMHMARGGSSSPILSAKHASSDGVLTPPSTSHGVGGGGADRVPLARQSSIESDDRPPAFSPGNFKDPVYEKVQASAAMREEYEARDVEGGGYKDWH